MCPLNPRLQLALLRPPRALDPLTLTFPTAKAKKIRGNLPHLDLLAALRNPIPTMMPPYVLKRHMPRIAHAAMDLNRPVRRLRAQPVRPVVAHADLIPEPLLDLYVRHAVHQCCCLTDQQPQHAGLRVQLDQRELDALVVGERRAEGLALVGVGDGGLDAEDGCAERGGCLPDAVLVHEGLSDGEAVVEGAEEGGGGHPDVVDRDGCVVGGHVERPLVLVSLRVQARHGWARVKTGTYHS